MRIYQEFLIKSSFILLIFLFYILVLPKLISPVRANSATASIVGPTTGYTNQDITFTATFSFGSANPADTGEIWVITQANSNPWPGTTSTCPPTYGSVQDTTGPWCRLASVNLANGSGTVTATFTPSADNSYYVLVKGLYDNGGYCIGYGGAATNGLPSCGSNSSISLTTTSNSNIPTGLKVEWNTNQSISNTPFPSLSWNNPGSIAGSIDAVVVRGGKNGSTTCGDTIEHWFISYSQDGSTPASGAPTLPSTSSCPTVTTSRFYQDGTGNNVPNIYIVPPAGINQFRLATGNIPFLD